MPSIMKSIKTFLNKNGEVREIQTGMLVEERVLSGSQSVLNWLLDRLNFID